MSGGASLAEMMGKKSKKQGAMGLGDLKGLLGEGMPEMKFSPVGRMRLVKALQQRFGEGFRSIPGVKNIMKEFDDHVETEVRVQKMKMLSKG